MIYTYRLARLLEHSFKCQASDRSQVEQLRERYRQHTSSKRTASGRDKSETQELYRRLDNLCVNFIASASLSLQFVPKVVGLMVLLSVYFAEFLADCNSGMHCAMLLFLSVSLNCFIFSAQIIKMDAKTARTIILYYYKQGLQPKQIKLKIDESGTDIKSSYSTVKYWVSEFKRGRESVEDEPRSGRPPEVATSHEIEQVRAIIEKNRRTGCRPVYIKA